MNQNNLLEKYKKQIEEISSKELNSDQKNLAIQILEKFEPNKLEYVFPSFPVWRQKFTF
ncbi:Putative type III restriction-modification system: methylase [Mesomycoplasma ovipneumoniae]|nr:Putative type III restriction-modification system: methylase [Mesomycoplasma ovipneumoniae]